MTARKKAEPKEIIRVGDQVEYDGKQYKVVYQFGSKDQYTVIEDEDNRFSVKTEAIHKVGQKTETKAEQDGEK